MPLMMSEKYYKPIQKELEFYFHELYWKDILSLLDDPQYLLNSSSALLSAIRAGRVFYDNGTFRGKFNAKISKELSKFAKFDGRTKTWKGLAPPEISAAAAVANSKGRQLSERITALISEIPAKVEAAVDSLKYSIDTPLFMMSEQADKDLNTIGVAAEMTPELSDRLIENYTTNQNINIKNWTPDQTEKLRDMIERNALAGYSRPELVKMISAEYGTTMNKAKFLARNETHLFMAEVRNERYSAAGLQYYIWSNSGDIKVVGNPAGLYPEGSPGHGNHWVMGGKVCKLSDPTVYADSIEDAKKGLWKSKASIGADNTHPGQAYNDRCTAKPVII